MITPRRTHLYSCPAHGALVSPKRLSTCPVCKGYVNKAVHADFGLFGAVVQRYRRAFWKREAQQSQKRKRREGKEKVE